MRQRARHARRALARVVLVVLRHLLDWANELEDDSDDDDAEELRDKELERDGEGDEKARP